MVRKTTSTPTASSIAAYVKKNAAKVRNAQKRKHAHAESVREADHNGHHIVIRTTYQIEVDGKLLMGHMGVTNDGQVHYHPVPNLSFASAVDLVKQLIDIFPGDFGEAGGEHGDTHGHPVRHETRRGRSDRRKGR